MGGVYKRSSDKVVIYMFNGTHIIFYSRPSAGYMMAAAYFKRYE